MQLDYDKESISMQLDSELESISGSIRYYKQNIWLPYHTVMTYKILRSQTIAPSVDTGEL